MAVFQVKLANRDISVIVACPRDGKVNMFKHGPRLLTCNTCGETFETPSEATLVIEQVVIVSQA